MFSKIDGLVMAGLLILTAAARVSAESIHFTQTSGYTYINGVPVSFDTGQVAGPTAGSVGPSVDGSQSAESFGSADFGTLKGFSTATSLVALELPQTQLNARWEDTIHVFSPGGLLPGGTPITLSFTLHLSDTLSSVPFGPGYTGSNAWAYLDGVGANAGLSVHDYFGTPPLLSTVSETYATTIGSDLLIGGVLQTNSGPQNALATADASNTGLFAMNILTDGASYTSASGTIYATSIVESAPEPATLLLAGFTLVFGVARGRAGKPARRRTQR